jgi:hypothetical protein
MNWRVGGVLYSLVLLKAVCFTVGVEAETEMAEPAAQMSNPGP